MVIAKASAKPVPMAHALSACQASERWSSESDASSLERRAKKGVVSEDKLGDGQSTRGSLTDSDPSTASASILISSISSSSEAEPRPTQSRHVAATWAEKMKQRRAARKAAKGDAKSSDILALKFTSILSELAPDRVEDLHAQLVACGLDSSAHLELLLHCIMEKALGQRDLIDACADLCAQLQDSCLEHTALSKDSKGSFRGMLLRACEGAFQNFLAPKTPMEHGEPQTDTRLRASLRFAAALFARKLLPRTVMQWMVMELLSRQTAQSLENLVVLLVILGERYDVPGQSGPAMAFQHIEELTNESSVPANVRLLLRGVLELRGAGWKSQSLMNTRPTAHACGL